jgi:hypothetical protein
VGDRDAFVSGRINKKRENSLRRVIAIFHGARPVFAPCAGSLVTGISITIAREERFFHLHAARGLLHGQERSWTTQEQFGVIYA